MMDVTNTGINIFIIEKIDSCSYFTILCNMDAINHQVNNKREKGRETSFNVRRIHTHIHIHTDTSHDHVTDYTIRYRYISLVTMQFASF